MSKVILLFFVVYSVSGFAQSISLNVFTEFVNVQSYNGVSVQNQQRVFIQVSNSGETSTKGWSLRVSPAGPITAESKTFPPQYLKYRVSSVEAPVPNRDGISASISNMNLITGQVPFASTGAYLAVNSPYNLKAQYYLGITIYYNMIIEGGAYLQNYVSNTNYSVPVLMELLNSSGKVIDSKNYSYGLRIDPSGNPPVEPSYGMSFDANAKNVLLEFNTANDYVSGLSKTQSKAFSTFSKTGYVVRVNTLNSNLVSSTNKTLPVSAVKLTVKDNQSQAVTGNVTLSTAQQNVISSTAHTATKFFDTIYSTQPGDPTFFNKSPEQYSGTLVYTMIPQ